MTNMFYNSASAFTFKTVLWGQGKVLLIVKGRVVTCHGSLIHKLAIIHHFNTRAKKQLHRSTISKDLFTTESVHVASIATK